MLNVQLMEGFQLKAKKRKTSAHQPKNHVVPPNSLSTFFSAPTQVAKCTDQPRSIPRGTQRKEVRLSSANAQA